MELWIHFLLFSWKIINMINKHIACLQAKSNSSKEAFCFKTHDMITCTKHWTCIKIKLVCKNYDEHFRENKAIK